MLGEGFSTVMVKPPMVAGFGPGSPLMEPDSTVSLCGLGVVTVQPGLTVSTILNVCPTGRLEKVAKPWLLVVSQYCFPERR